MGKEKLKELLVGFLAMMIFVISIAVCYLSYRIEKMEKRIDYVEQDINRITYGC